MIKFIDVLVCQFQNFPLMFQSFTPSKTCSDCTQDIVFIKNILQLFSNKMNQDQEIPNQIDIVSVLSEIIRKFERYNSAVETKNM